MKAAEKAERRAYLGASEFGAILGLDRFKKPIDVFMAKTGMLEEEDDSEQGPAAWGRFLERVIVRRWQDETGLPLTGDRYRKQRTFVHPDYPFIRATPDAYHRNPLVRGDRRAGSIWRPAEYAVEAKTSRAGRGFGEPGTDEIPRNYRVQAIVQSAVTGAPVVHVPVLIAGSDFRRYIVEPTDAQRAAVIAAGVEFWNDHVLKNEPPPEISEEYARAKWPTDSGDELVATDADEKLVEGYRLARTNREQAEVAEGEAKVAIMARMGDHSRFLGRGFSVSLKKTKDVETIDWKLIAADFEKMILEMREKPRAEIEPEIAFVKSMHTATRAGSRVFRPTFHEEEDSR